MWIIFFFIGSQASSLEAVMMICIVSCASFREGRYVNSPDSAGLKGKTCKFAASFCSTRDEKSACLPWRVEERRESTI